MLATGRVEQEIGLQDISTGRSNKLDSLSTYQGPATIRPLSEINTYRCTQLDKMGRDVVEYFAGSMDKPGSRLVQSHISEGYMSCQAIHELNIIKGDFTRTLRAGDASTALEKILKKSARVLGPHHGHVLSAILRCMLGETPDVFLHALAALRMDQPAAPWDNLALTLQVTLLAGTSGHYIAYDYCSFSMQARCTVAYA